MANRIYDLVIFGASGFTGQFVVEEVARQTNDIPNFKWAVAGRKEKKLRQALEKATEVTGHDLSNVGVVVADVSDDESLNAMSQKTKLVLNCVGPYRFFGEQVVKACIENGSHHIDISGEPWYLELMENKYNEQASEQGVYVIGACGFDSIPAEFGLQFTKDKFPGILNTAESFLTFNTGEKGGKVNYGTWHSAVYGLGFAKELIDMRKQYKKEPLPKYTPKLTKRPSYFWNEDLQRWCVPFPGADASVVRRSQGFLWRNKQIRPVQYGAYFTISSTFYLLCLMVFGLLFGFLAKYEFGRSLLLKYPGFFSMGIFSKDGPTREQVDGTSFSMSFVGEGFSSEEVEKTGKHDKKISTKVSGPEPGYITTPIAMVQAGLTLLQEQDKMPGNGGVLSAGAAFAETSLIERLEKNGLHFSVIESK